MKKTLIIAKKELFEIFRDKQTLIILALPFFLFSMFNFGMSFINQQNVSDMKISITSNNTQAYKQLENYIKNENQYTIKQFDFDEPIQNLKNGDLDFIVKIDNNDVDIIFNSSSFNSISLATKFGERFQKFYYENINTDSNQISRFNLKNEENNFVNIENSISKIFAPIVIILLIFQGISNFANDIFAGEKERKTLEMLLLSGTKRKYIYFGKLFALFIIEIINLLFVLSSYFVSYSFSKSGISQFGFMNNGNTVVNILVIICELFILSIYATLTSCTVSLVSKKVKNSQMINGILQAVPIGFVVLIMIGAINSSNVALKFLPVLNSIVCFNQAFSGDIHLTSIISSLIINFTFISLIIKFGLKYLKSEKILL